MKVVIPARYASSRLPGKPLLDIAGKPMIQRVWAQAVKAVSAENAWIATDDQRIMDAVSGFGGQVVMTQEAHESGTDRIAEVVDNLGFDDAEVVINVQGDEPLIPPGLIRQVGQCLDGDPAAHMATASVPITDAGDVTNSNVVKLVASAAGYAAYFSRSAIPYNRDTSDIDMSRCMYQRHIGLYAYRAGTVRALTALPPAPTEKMEMLEQLRALWHGMKIRVLEIEEAPPHGVDTQADLDAVRALLSEGSSNSREQAG